MSVAFVFNILLILLLIGFVVAFVVYKVKKTDVDEKRDDLTREKEKYSIEKMKEYIKKQFDEITRMNLYDFLYICNNISNLSWGVNSSKLLNGIALFIFSEFTL